MTMAESLTRLQMPNPPHKPTEKSRNDVRNMAAVGITQEDIVKVIRVDLKTLRKHYRVELDESLVKANAQVGGALFTKAKNGDTAAMIWWEKTRAGKSDKTIIGGDPDNPISLILKDIDGQSTGLPEG